MLTRNGYACDNQHFFALQVVARISPMGEELEGVTLSMHRFKNVEVSKYFSVYKDVWYLMEIPIMDSSISRKQPFSLKTSEN